MRFQPVLSVSRMSDNWRGRAELGHEGAIYAGVRTCPALAVSDAWAEEGRAHLEEGGYLVALGLATEVPVVEVVAQRQHPLRVYHTHTHTHTTHTRHTHDTRHTTHTNTHTTHTCYEEGRGDDIIGGGMCVRS
jgi:hypothetical protein